MEFSQQLTIDGKVFDFVDVQRDGSTAIYKNVSAYLRVGDVLKIQKDLARHKQMEGCGFPVAKLLAEGTIAGMAYFIEESLGDRHYGIIFKEETEEFGAIRDQTFDQFVDFCVRFAQAQLKTVTGEQDWPGFEKGIHLDILCQEMPAEKEKILSKYRAVQKKLAGVPFMLSHGDMTTFNILPKGIIDFEDSFMGPAGYDLGALVEHLNWFPESTDYEYYRLYDFTPAQRQRFLDRIDDVYSKVKLPKLSDHLAEFNFTRGIWFAVRMGHAPKLGKFRHDEIRKLIS